MTFKYENTNRLIELDYDSSYYQKTILDYFNDNIRDKSNDYMSGERTWHVDYGPLKDVNDWQFLMVHFEEMMGDAGSSLDFDEFKHTLKFTFIELESGHNLIPHTAAYIRAMCSVNIPLAGTLKIDLYRDNIMNLHEPGPHIIRHHYTNPIILGVNQWHGVRRDSFLGKVDPLFSRDVPWSTSRGNVQLIERKLENGLIENKLYGKTLL